MFPIDTNVLEDLLVNHHFIPASTLKMDAEISSEMLVPVSGIACCHHLEDRTSHIYLLENPKPHEL
jgi:hypothetical protein